MNYLFVGLGGVFGALSRYYLGTTIQLISVAFFPYGTLTVNLLGSFFLSFIAYGSLLKWKLPRPAILAINTGFIGSFTTFSTFTVETINLLKNDHLLAALTYVIVSITIGLIFSYLGVNLAQKLYQADTDRSGGANS